MQTMDGVRWAGRRIGTGVMVIASIAALSACGSSDDDAKPEASAASSSSGGSAPAIPEGPIKIGAPLALTGSISFVDVPQRAGIELAIEDINAKGGVLGHKLELEVRDTKSNLSQVANAATELLDGGANFMIPTLDYDFGGPSARAATARKIISVSTAGDPRFGLQGIGKYHYNVYPASPTEGSAAAQFMFEKGWKEAYLLTDTSFNHSKSVCKAFKDQFAKLGGKVTGEDTFQNADQSIATQITRMRGKLGQTKGIMLCSLPPGGVSALRQIRAAGIDLPIALDAAFDGTFWVGAVPKEENTYVMSTGSVDPAETESPEQQRILKAFKKKTGDDANFGVGLFTGYSAVQAIAKGVEQAKSIDSDAVAAKLNQFKAEELAIGPVTWSDKCHVSLGSPETVLRIVKGKQKYVTQITPSYVDKSVC